jgi:methanogenic corrinoid protein MtbC1
MQHRTQTNRRRYGDNELRRIINISILKRNGFKISRIANFSEAEIEEKVTFLSKNTSVAGTQVDSMVRLMIDCDEKAVNELLMRDIMNRGIEDSFTQIVFPFLNRIGIMWHTGSADIGSEHFISNVFRQRLISAIDSLSSGYKSDGKRIILFLPENELHELGLLFFNYVIRKQGIKTLYLGQSTPLDSVIQIGNKWNADIIVTGLMSGFPGINPDLFLTQLAKAFPGKKVLVAGILADFAINAKNTNIFPIRTAEDLKSYL